MPTSRYRSTGMQQILTRLEGSENEKIIYTPETGVGPENEPLPFFAFIDTLRVKISLPSLAETPLPEGFDDLGQSEQRAALRDILYVSPHMIFDLILEDAGGSRFIPASIGIIQKSPFYHFSLLTYLTDSAVWPVAAGVKMIARVRDIGFGGLDLGDSVEVFGSARTEAPQFVEETQVITITTYGSSTQPPSGPVANQVTMNGEPVTMNGEPVTFSP